MQLLEEKKQYIKCNILIKFKQLYLLILCFLVSAILSIAFAIVKFNKDNNQFSLKAVALRDSLLYFFVCGNLMTLYLCPHFLACCVLFLYGLPFAIAR